MTTITLQDLQRDPAHWTHLAAQAPEPIMITEAGRPLATLNAAKSTGSGARLPNREAEIQRLPQVSDAALVLEELRT